MPARSGPPPGVTPTPKQVVFLFMAAAVTAVVSFLFGVLVGRGATAERPAGAGSDAPAGRDGPALVAGGAPEALPDGLEGDGLSYYERLESDTAVEEALGPPAARAAEERRDPAGAPAAPEGGTREGFTVQVATLRDREVAQRIANRLVARGFPAFVADPAGDAPVPLYRVRVGRYADHGIAERMRRRLETEEQFQPWITRR